MPISLALLTAIQSEPPVVAGSRYVALAGTPPMTGEDGHALDPLKVMFHEFRFVRRDADGTSHFVMDGIKAVRTKAVDPFRKDALRPLVESGELSRLRQRDLGRKVWSYGRFQAGRWIESHWPNR